MADFDRSDLLAYMRSARLGVISTIGDAGEPQSALVGIGTTDAHEVVFDTLSTSRKHKNLEREPRIALVIPGPGEQTLQYQGIAAPVPTHGPAGAPFREAYYQSWPDGPDRVFWPNLVYWRIAPLWARYSDFDRGPLIVEFAWAEPNRAKTAPGP